MKYSLLFFFLCLVITLCAQVPNQPQSLTPDRAESFIRTLIYDRPSLEKYFDPTDFATSNRLRIQYEGVDWKILIGHDIDSNIREKIKANEVDYSIKIRTLENPYSKVLFTTSDSTFKQVFFFKNELMISPLTYFTRNMIKFERGYATFYTSDPTLLSDYSMTEVSSFIKRQSRLIASFFDEKSKSEWMSFQDASWRHYYGIHYNPLLYLFCKDEHQMEQITGFNTLGISDLSMDAVISTSNSHFHELIHLIMNFNLNPIPLYTHPLFQEGIATCLGGRGGRSADVMLQTGEWLRNMNIIPLDTLLSSQSFKEQDASISYPLSALICQRYIEKYGMKKFTNLYKKYSTDEDTIGSLSISPIDLNLNTLFKQTKNNGNFESIISCRDLSKGLFDSKTNLRPVYQNQNIKIWNATSINSKGTYWKFEGLGTFLSKSDDPDIFSTGSYKGYKSRIFKEKYPDKTYQYEHYLLVIKESEISLYDLYLDQLIAYYSNEFVPADQQIVVNNGKVTFYLEMDQQRFRFILEDN